MPTSSRESSAKFNSILSFHGFPTHSDLRRQWLVNISRDHVTIISHIRVCCRHFASDQLIETERRPELVPPDDQEEHRLTRDRDYCSVPEPSALDISASAAEDLSKDLETLRKEIQELRVQREFGLQRFAGSDTKPQKPNRLIRDLNPGPCACRRRRSEVLRLLCCPPAKPRWLLSTCPQQRGAASITCS
uniref:THAP-type domain-containing protein n=1 Tax=Maylandia zebra TaxID=106582 RepID=A0A3P9CAR9_9CICH